MLARGATRLAARVSAVAARRVTVPTVPAVPAVPIVPLAGVRAWASQSDDRDAMPAGTVEPKTQRPETGSGTVTLQNSHAPMHPAAEIKDPAVIFNTVWSRLEAKYGAENMMFPSEIVWLMGAPGAGKGTNTPFIQQARSITNAPIVISNILSGDASRQLINAGVMISDAYVLELLLEAMLKGDYKSGVIVDGFPRTAVQVDTTKLLFDKMQEQRKNFFNTPLRPRFGRPVFRLVVLFVDEEESVRRQLERGRQAREHNERVRRTGRGELVEERMTDADEQLIRKRYRIFKEHYDAMLGLRDKFHFHLIDASPSIDRVRSVILKELEYQSSLELEHRTYDLLQHIPLSSEIGKHSRQDLVRRLDGYLNIQPDLFRDAIKYVEQHMIPHIRRHAMAGRVLIRSDHPQCTDPSFVSMVLDILSERGYHVNVDSKVIEKPVRVDPTTFEIICTRQTLWFFQVAFQKQFLRSADAT